MKLSIVIPSYNCFDKTYKLVKSLEKQDLTNTEVIVVNDASTTPYYDFPKWIKYIKLDENNGAVNARKQGYLEAQGEFIWFFDGDDQITDGSIKKIVASLNSDFDLHVYRMMKQKKNKSTFEFPVKISTPASVGYSSYFGDKIFKRSIIENNMFDMNAKIFQDENFILRFGSKVNSVWAHREIEPVSCYLYTDESISKSAKMSTKKVINLVENVVSLIDFIKQLPEGSFKENAKKQMLRMLSIARGWNLIARGPEKRNIDRSIRHLKKHNKSVFGKLGNYTTAYYLTGFVFRLSRLEFRKSKYSI